MRSASLAAALALTFVASGAIAQNFPGAPGVSVLEGKCGKLVVGKLDASKGCKGELATVTIADGTVTFIFSSDGKMLGFEGDGKSIAPADNGTVRFPVEIVSSGVGTKVTGQVKATGFCTFGNPFSGKPTTIDCAASTKAASFSGSFRTNGKPPRSK